MIWQITIMHLHYWHYGLQLLWWSTLHSLIVFWYWCSLYHYNQLVPVRYMFFEHRIVEEKLRRSCTNIVVIGQIYFLDVQVWYTVTSALLGGLEGAKDRLGEVGSQSKPIHSMISYKLKQNLIILHWQTASLTVTPILSFTKFQCCLEENFCWLWHETREE